MKKQTPAKGIAMPQLKTTNSKFRHFTADVLPPQQLRQLKGGGDGDSADIIVEIDIVDH